jgi:hypothetical protein
MNILIREEELNSGDKYDLINGVIEYVNGLLEAHYQSEEIPIEAFFSYYVDYYLQQTLNGGISQFVYNSNWNPQVINFVENGLRDIKAKKNLELFLKVTSKVSSINNDLTEYLQGDYFDSHTDVRDLLNDFNDEFYNLQESEDLVELNYNYVRHLPNLEVLATSDYRNKFQKLRDSVPDKENRLRQAEENEPEHIKIIKKLCKKSDQELLTLNAGSFAEYNGDKVFEMHISTSLGHHYVIILDSSALLFNGTTKELITEIAI